MTGLADVDGFKICMWLGFQHLILVATVVDPSGGQASDDHLYLS